MDYGERIRNLFIKLMEAASESLELDKHYVDEALKIDSMAQIFVGNYYPPCPQPDQAVGIPPHTDSGHLQPINIYFNLLFGTEIDIKYVYHVK